MARIMSIDYGVKRCGIAVTDTLQIIANGLTTVKSSELLVFIRTYIEREPVECIVMGKPKQVNNKPSENMRHVTAFINTLHKHMPHIKVELYDERFTSVIAHRTMIDAGLGRKARANKELVDEISATIILQDYLESKKYNKL
jgi:putative Holliday junction resolvase